MSMLTHWQKMIMGKIPIDITSLVMSIAVHVGVLENAQVTYLALGGSVPTPSWPRAFCAGTSDA
jgi:hypothetical protein